MPNVDAASSAQHTTPIPKPESPLRLIVVAVGWLCLALAMVVIADLAVSLVTEDKSVLRNDLSAVATTIALYGMLLWAAIVRGRVVGGGDVRTGLGDGPVTGWPVVASIGVLAVTSVVLAVAAYYYGYFALPGRSWGEEKSLWVHFFSAFATVLVAPSVEEFWFRGWLWTGLRRHWGVPATAFATAVLFVAMHVPQTYPALGHYALAAVLLSLARHFGGSIRASIAIHTIWNLTTNVAAASFVLWGG